jgi:transketolase
MILSNIPRVPTSITAILRELSKRYQIPLPTLRRNAQVLRELNLIRYGDVSNFSGVELTELGLFISNLTLDQEPSLLENMVHTRSGLRPFGSVIKDLRKTVLRMIAEAGSGHLGASLSAIDIIAVLYFMKMRHDPGNHEWSERDRFILSKGHAAPALYAVLAELGYFPTKDLMSLRSMGSILQGHPDTKTPGIDVGTGSLGQGLSLGVGMALAAKMDASKYKIYVLLGDGELNEGQVWEAALTAAHYKLDNLITIIDRNGFQLTGSTSDIKSLEPLYAKWEAFGWEVLQANGNDPSDFLNSLQVSNISNGKPFVIIAHTIKGKGISFMEGNKFSRKAPSTEELARALAELT